MFKDQVARAAHEILRAYCEALGDFSHPEWGTAPSWQIDTTMASVHLHWDRDLSPEATHDAWMAHKLAQGWVFGPVKDYEKKQHPCLVPFDQLPKEQQIKDHLIAAIIRALRPPKPAPQRVAAEGFDAYKGMGVG